MTAEGMRTRLHEVLGGMTDELVKQLYPEVLIRDAIDAVGFHMTCVHLPYNQWPTIEGPLDEARERPCDRTLTIPELQAAMQADNEEFLSPLDALRYAKTKKPRSWVGVLFYVENEPCCLAIQAYGDNLYLHVGRISTHTRWHGDENALSLVRPRRSE